MTESLSSTVLLSRIARVETGEDILLSRHPSSPPIMRTDGIALPRKPTLDGDVDRSFLTEDLREQPNNSGEDRESNIRSNGPVLLVYEHAHSSNSTTTSAGAFLSLLFLGHH